MSEDRAVGRSLPDSVHSAEDLPALTDAHCHLDQVSDLDEVIATAVDLGVTRMLANSEDGASMQATLRAAERFPGTVVPGLGLHPALLVHRRDADVAEDLDLFRQELHRAAFVGEVGLDYLHAASSSQRQRQREILMAQLELAGRDGAPICLHSRRAQRETMDVAVQFSQTWGVPALLHWFTHSAKLVRRACAVPGVFVSAGPSILVNPATLAVSMAIPLDRLLVETDCPVPYGGESARPAWIPRVVQTLAHAHGMRYACLAAVLDENLHRFLYSSTRRLTARGGG